MNFTLAIPSLNYPTAADLPPLELPFLSKLMQFGKFKAAPASASAFYAEYLWQGSLLARAKEAAGLPVEQATVLVSPVWLQMGMNQVNMLDGADIGIQADEAQRLCAELSDFYSDELCQFYPVRPDLWLAVMPNQPQWQTEPFWDVLGPNDGSVRTENHAADWLRMQTEIQMWLHNHAINESRSRAKVPPINGVWLWNDLQGKASESLPLGCESGWAQFYSGRRLDASYDWQTWLDALEESGLKGADSVVFLPDLAATGHTADVWTYKDTLEQWDQRWFAPLWQALSEGRLKNLVIATDGESGGELHIKAKAGRAFWKKSRVFAGSLGA